ncbi:MAG: hypothetical protein QM784_07450 [Polyangiaceae bacterium]
MTLRRVTLLARLRDHSERDGHRARFIAPRAMSNSYCLTAVGTSKSTDRFELPTANADPLAAPSGLVAVLLK